MIAGSYTVTPLDLTGTAEPTRRDLRQSCLPIDSVRPHHNIRTSRMLRFLLATERREVHRSALASLSYRRTRVLDKGYG